MRIHCLSDLHLEFGPLQLPEAVRTGELAELVLLAGDIDVKRRGPRWAAATFSQRTCLIFGNHEGYRDNLWAAISAGRATATELSDGKAFPIRFLERESWEFLARDGTPVRLLGATLWTDFKLFGAETRESAMHVAAACMNDFDLIKLPGGDGRKRRFNVYDSLSLHSASRRWLEEMLARPFPGVTIVVTHHAPSIRSVSDQYKNDLTSAAYASDLEPLIEQFQPALWVHGHMHTSCDYRVGRTRIVCNPRGYHPDDLNPDFDPAFVVEL